MTLSTVCQLCVKRDLCVYVVYSLLAVLVVACLLRACVSQVFLPLSRRYYITLHYSTLHYSTLHCHLSVINACLVDVWCFLLGSLLGPRAFFYPYFSGFSIESCLGVCMHRQDYQPMWSIHMVVLFLSCFCCKLFAFFPFKLKIFLIEMLLIIICSRHNF